MDEWLGKDRERRIGHSRHQNCNGPTIEPPEPRFKSGEARTTVPAIPSTMANASLLPIFSFKRKVDSIAMKMGPSEVKNAATPDETVFSAKFSDKW